MICFGNAANDPQVIGFLNVRYSITLLVGCCSPRTLIGGASRDAILSSTSNVVSTSDMR